MPGSNIVVCSAPKSNVLNFEPNVRLSLHVLLVGEECLDLDEQLLLHNVRDEGAALGGYLPHQVFVCDVVQTALLNNLL